MRKYVNFDNRTIVVIVLFALLTVWWIWLQVGNFSHEDSNRYFFGACYGIVALFGAGWGMQIARQWGGFKSVLGRTIFFLSLGLFAEEFGQLVFSYFNIIKHVDVPYPSLADLGFFSNIPLYLIGIIFLAKASGGFYSVKNKSRIIQIVFFPIVLLSLSYFAFLKNHQYDWSNPLTVFLDFAYPMGQAAYLSVAILTYSLSRRLLGGVMKNKIILVIIAFLFQYLADYNFLYQNSRQTWVNAGYGDYLYLIAYFVMTLGLLQLNTGLLELKEGK